VQAFAGSLVAFLGPNWIRVSADSLTDEQSGEANYSIEAAVPLSELARIDELRSPFIQRTLIDT